MQLRFPFSQVQLGSAIRDDDYVVAIYNTSSLFPNFISDSGRKTNLEYDEDLINLNQITSSPAGKHHKHVSACLPLRSQTTLDD